MDALVLGHVGAQRGLALPPHQVDPQRLVCIFGGGGLFQEVESSMKEEVLTFTLRLVDERHAARVQLRQLSLRPLWRGQPIGRTYRIVQV